MNRFAFVLLALAACGLSQAANEVVNRVDGPWVLYKGTTKVSTAPTVDACIALAIPLNPPRKTWSCKATTKFETQLVVIPPPVDATCRDNGWTDVGAPVPAACPVSGQQTQAQIHTWTTLTPAANGGKECPASQTQTITKTCVPPMHMGPPVDPAKIMTPAVGLAVSTFKPPVNPPTSVDGAFRPQCTTSHQNYDDSILYQNQPGGSPHLHEYAGNTGSNAASTTESLMTAGNSTCQQQGIDNRSTYWWPPPVDQFGRPRVAYSLMFYYKQGTYTGANGPAASIVDFPSGFSMIAGNFMTETVDKPPYQTHFNFSCFDPVVGAGDANWSHIPACAPGKELWVALIFPSCWNGTQLQTANGRDHVRYPANGVCPAGFPVQLATMTFNMHYKVEPGDDTTKWYLSSDMYYGTKDANGVLKPGGFTMHGDYRAAWKIDSLKTMMDACVRSMHDCG